MVKDKVVLITGGNTGIGAATAKLLARNGARVIINYREDKESAEKLVTEICDLTNNTNSAMALKADVTKDEEVKEMVEQILNKCGQVDVLINNACPKTFSLSFSETTWKDYEVFLNTNLKGAYNLIQAVLPSMLKNKTGSIINMLTSYVVNTPPPKISPYITAKYALEGFSKSLASELGAHNIRVNMVSPGVTKTKFTNHLPEKMFDLISMQTPLKSLSSTEDVAEVLLFLSSEKSKHLTGVNIPVCGGLVML